jgi:hypothetical protein
MREEEVQPITIRFPVAVYEQLRKAAFDQRTPMTRIVIAAVEKELKVERENER